MPRLRDLLDFAARRPPRDLAILERPPEGRAVDTRHGGPNMPRYQLCDCGLSSRRVRKTVGGASYKCRRHGEFFVRTA